MKIIRLNAENIKRLKAVEITPNGAVQIVAGRNAQGKSSVLDSIWMALDWKDASKTTPRPVRDGEDTAQVRLELDDLIVTRKWANGNTTLVVESRDGTMRPKRPQELLDSLLGRLSFDPLEFTQQSGREQVQTLLSLVELPFDPADIDQERKEAYEARTEIGRDLARAKGSLESMPTPRPGLPAEEISSRDVLAEYDAAVAEIQRHAEVRRALDVAESEVEYANVDVVQEEQAVIEAETALAEAKKALVGAEAKRARKRDAVATVEKDVDSLPTPPDLSAIKDRLDSVEATNAEIRESGKHQLAKRTVARLQAAYDEKKAAIAELDKYKADGLAAAKFPVEGLSFAEDGVTYNGVPLCQVASSDSLKVGMAIAMASNPTLRVIRIKDGPLLDSENMAVIEQMAVDHDYQVWIERVDESGACGVVIEDGMVVS